MSDLYPLFYLLIFPGGLSLLLLGLIYIWFNGKLLARFQNRVGPRWFQPLADTLKLMSKEDIVTDGSARGLFMLLPMLALTGVLTAGLYVPLLGLPPAASLSGDLIIVLYLLSMVSFALGLIGLVSPSQYATIGSARVMTQLFAYEVPFFLAMLGPAFVANSWRIQHIIDHQTSWMLFMQPLGFGVALISLMGKLGLPPFDAPEAETEIVAGALTEYTGRRLALFKLAKGSELVIGLTLIAALYLGGIANLPDFLLKTLFLLLILTGAEALITRLRIDQTVTLWWHYGLLLVLGQWLLLIVFQI